VYYPTHKGKGVFEMKLSEALLLFNNK